MLYNAQTTLDTFPRSFPVDGEVANNTIQYSFKMSDVKTHSTT